MARRVASSESLNVGRISPSSSERVRRTSVWRPGNETGMSASVSADSASFASTQSVRSRDMAATVPGSSGSSSWRAGPTRSTT